MPPETALQRLHKTKSIPFHPEIAPFTVRLSVICEAARNISRGSGAVVLGGAAASSDKVKAS